MSMREYPFDPFDPPKSLVDSSRWTGRYPQVMHGKRTRWGFKSSKQLALFMIWDEHWREGEVVYANITFTTRDYDPRPAIRMVRRHIRALYENGRWRFHRWLQRWVYDNSKCAVCKESCYVFPANPFSKGYCPEHCPDHDYVYEHGIGKMCQHCGIEPPYDYYDCD